MRPYTFLAVVAAVTFLTSAAAGLAQVERPRPADIPSDKNMILFTGRGVGVSWAALRKTNPMFEAYLQKVVSRGKRGDALISDRYYLGRVKFAPEPTLEGLLDPEENADYQELLDGFASLMLPDWTSLAAGRYKYEFVERTFFGAVRVVVFDVKPLGGDGFSGKLFFEDKSWNLVRFTGTNGVADAKMASLRGKDTTFKVDVWFVSAPKGVWLPAFGYIEEQPRRIDAPADVPRWRGHLRWWGYDPKAMYTGGQSVDVQLEESASTADTPSSRGATPPAANRLFEQYAEQNVLRRLTDAFMLGARGEVDKSCDQILTNLIVTNKFALGSPLHCRVLLTTPLEAFIVGDTIVVNRTLLDLCRTESGCALILAHQIAHKINGDKTIESRFSYIDALMISDRDLLKMLHFVHNPIEEAAATAKALEIVGNSPYAGKMNEAARLVQALRARSRQLPHLVTPFFGEHIVDAEDSMEKDLNLREEIPYDADDDDQEPAALQIAAKIFMNPFDGKLEFLRSAPIANPERRERAEFQVLPFSPFLNDAPDTRQDVARAVVDTPKPPESQPAGQAVRPPESAGANRAKSFFKDASTNSKSTR